MQSRVESSPRPDTERLGVARKVIIAEPLLPCVSDLGLGEDEQLGGQQSSAETNKTTTPREPRSPECLRRQIHMVVLGWMERPTTQTLCLFAPPPRRPTTFPTTFRRHSTFLTMLPRCLYSTAATKTIQSITEHPFSTNLSRSLQNCFARMESESFRTAPTLTKSPCDASSQSAYLAKLGKLRSARTYSLFESLFEHATLYEYIGRFLDVRTTPRCTIVFL